MVLATDGLPTDEDGYVGDLVRILIVFLIQIVSVIFSLHFYLHGHNKVEGRSIILHASARQFGIEMTLFVNVPDVSGLVQTSGSKPVKQIYVSEQSHFDNKLAQW